MVRYCNCWRVVLETDRTDKTEMTGGAPSFPFYSLFLGGLLEAQEFFAAVAELWVLDSL